MSWLQKLKQGLSKTSNKISESLVTVFVKKKLDQETLDELEELLISSDLGVHTSHHIITQLAKHKFDKEITIDEIKNDLAQIIVEILQSASKAINIINKPHVILVCGVNGNGKTTTIGKLAAKFAKEGHKITMAACDTFRAAGVRSLRCGGVGHRLEFADQPECDCRPRAEGRTQGEAAGGLSGAPRRQWALAAAGARRCQFSYAGSLCRCG